MSLAIIKDTRMEGLRQLAQRFAHAGQRVVVGVPESAVEADGTKIAMIAAIHEFGSPEHGIPERSFIRTGILNNLSAIVGINAHNIRAIANGGLTVVNALDRLGVFTTGAIQRQITDGSYAPNAPSTIKAKGSSKPLIASGSLRQSISYQIVSQDEYT